MVKDKFDRVRSVLLGSTALAILASSPVGPRIMFAPEDGSGSAAPPAGETVASPGTPAEVKEPATLLGSEGPVEGEAVKPGETPGAEGEAGKKEGEGEGEGEAKKEGEGDDKKAADPLDLVPEGDAKYEIRFDDESPVDQELVDEFSPIFKELGITTRNANKLATVMKEVRAREYTRFVDMVEGWLGEAKGDKEIGGVSFDANTAVAKRTVQQYGTPEFRKMLNITGVGNHPEMIRFLYRLGKEAGEAGTERGGAAAPVKSAADVLYGASE